MRRLCVELAALGLLVVALAAPAATAAPALSARAGGASAAAYSKTDVQRAFTRVQIKLVSTLAGNESQQVTAMTAVVRKNLTHTKPWAVAVWVYDSEKEAREAFASGAPQWRSNGIASARVGNVVVTVVPKGREIGAEGPAFPMPDRVSRALHALART
jgi:hypothetical protein